MGEPHTRRPGAHAARPRPQDSAPPRPHLAMRKRHRGEACEQAVGDAVLVSKPITDRSSGIRRPPSVAQSIANDLVKEHDRPQIALSTTPHPFGREVSRVLIKRPTRLGAAPPEVGCVVRHSGTVHQQPGHLAQGPTRTRRYEGACAQAISTLSAIGWVWQGSQHASVTTRNGAIRE